MPRVVHIVTTSGFAGVERYICDVATATAARGWDVSVIGGDAARVPAALGDGVRWERGATPPESLRSVLRIGRADITHAHMTLAEAIAAATRLAHRAPIITTRHFAGRRGTSPAGRLCSPWIARRMTREIALGEFVARSVERRPQATVAVGVRSSACLWREANRVVLVLQRLEAEKDTATALRAWKASRLLEEGWSMRIVGEGSQRATLERLVAAESISGVTFTGWQRDVADELGRAGVLLACAPAEPLGLSVLEAMAAGVPVVASASGGHLETIGAVDGARLFPPGDVGAAAFALRAMCADSTRARLSAAECRVISGRFTIERHVDALLEQYEAVLSPHLARMRAQVSRGPR